MSFPLASLQTVSAENPWSYLVFLVIGFAFGYVLEIAGFGNSKKLAAQFYFRDLTVLKVMFGAIITAMVLIFLMVGLGVLDYSQVYVNTTYLWPMILGGLIMGVGFIVGGFCPGTSLVGMATGKIDGLFFVLGGLFGIFLFGETERFYDVWWQTAGYLGRFTVMDWLGLPAGVVVLLVVAMALFMFWGAEQLERIFGQRDLEREPRLRLAGGGALLAVAVAVVLIGTPSAEQKYARVAGVKDAALAQREVQIVPAELAHTLYDNTLQLTMLDVRSETDYNLFHLRGARHVAPVGVAAVATELLASAAANRVVVVMSNDEDTATQVWKTLVAEGVPNVYILEGGVNNWLLNFGADDPAITRIETPTPEALHYRFPAALGDRYKASAPSVMEYGELEYAPKIKLQIKRDKTGGGCG
jgi:rhodanese-related sulfurtransferase/uncharacterized membrane protein (DUF485 family)